MSALRYISQLHKRWGTRVPKQMYKMWKLHRTSFEVILGNIFEALDTTQSKFAFPTVAGVARMRSSFIKEIVREGHEIASHGYNHIRYPMLSAAERERDLVLSLQAFREMGIRISGFRAPYDNYTDDMPFLIHKCGLLWDGGFGYRERYRNRYRFFRLPVNGGETKTTFVPLNMMSDDLMIDGKGWGPSAVSAALKHEIKKAASTQGVIMFDLHPIRMGQKIFAPCLQEIAEYTQELGGWAPTPTEAVRYWNKHGKWKSDHGFCLLLTGDIDNWVFGDYLRRIIWQ